jgi:hypothetical protein
MPIFTLRPLSSVAAICRTQATAWLFEVSAALTRGAFHSHLFEQAAGIWSDAAAIEPNFTN